jgi:hypothetical protein
LDQLAFGLAQNKTQVENKSKVPTQEGSFHTPRQVSICVLFLKLKGQTLNIYKEFILALAFPLMKRQKETRLGLAFVEISFGPTS